MRNGVRCTQKQDLKSNTPVNCFSEASSMGHRRHDAEKIENSNAVDLSRLSSQYADDSSTSSCLLDSCTRIEISLTATSKAG